jgi:FkbM family methyltransferase
MRSYIRNLVRKSGFDIIRYQSPKIIHHYKFDLVFDVGANTGQYARELRVLGYRGAIISFEPLSRAFKVLEKNAEADAEWQAFNCAIGDADEQATINISENQVSNSIFDLHDIGIEASPESRYVGKETVQVKRLDSVFPDFYNGNQQVFLKIDTQGYEKNVLEGGLDALQHVTGLQMEMSLFPVYRDAELFNEMLKYINDKGFRLVHVRPGFCHPRTGLMMQLDAIFLRDSLVPSDDGI